MTLVRIFFALFTKSTLQKRAQCTSMAMPRVKFNALLCTHTGGAAKTALTFYGRKDPIIIVTSSNCV